MSNIESYYQALMSFVPNASKLISNSFVDQADR